MILTLLQETVSVGAATVSGTDLEGLVVVVLVLTAVVHIGFAFAVWGDARRLEPEEGRRLFASAGLWALATVLGGLIPATIYWVMHRSPLGHDAPFNRG